VDGITCNGPVFRAESRFLCSLELVIIYSQAALAFLAGSSVVGLVRVLNTGGSYSGNPTAVTDLSCQSLENVLKCSQFLLALQPHESSETVFVT
jgi:hypothetical protein